MCTKAKEQSIHREKIWKKTGTRLERTTLGRQPGPTPVAVVQFPTVHLGASQQRDMYNCYACFS